MMTVYLAQVLHIQDNKHNKNGGMGNKGSALNTKKHLYICLWQSKQIPEQKNNTVRLPVWQSSGLTV